MAHEVRLDVFAGPLDLLLHLITKQRVDIYEVSLATITDEYLAAVGGLEEIDLEAATGFLVIAATLLELKSLRLLPGRADEGDPSLLEERDLLLARLVEASTFRAAGASLRSGLEAGAAYHPRDVALEEGFANLVPDLLAGVTPGDLADAAVVALATPPEPELDVSHVAPITASVRDAIVSLARSLESSSSLGFRTLCAGPLRRIDVVVRFLALLELFKAGAITLAQGDRFGDIQASWTGEVDVHAVVEEVDEYGLQEVAR